MRLWMKRRSDALRTYTAECRTLFDTLPWERALRVDIKQPRNTDFDRLFHAMVQRIADSVGEDHDTIIDWFKLETGHYTLVSTEHRKLPPDDLAEQLRGLAKGSNVILAAADLIDQLQSKLINREKIHYKSISFENMDGLQFREFFNRCVVIMYEKWKIDPAIVADLLEPKTWKRPT